MTTDTTEFRGGFTLVEMLVVIGIIGILAATLITSFSYLKTTAKQSQAQALVGEVATAFTVYLQKERRWPDEWINRSNSEKVLDPEACAIFQKNSMLDLTTWQTLPGIDKDGAVVMGKGEKVNASSLDKFGLLDPWGRATLRSKLKKADENTDVESGGKIKDHRIQYRLDEDYDGYVDTDEGAPRGRIRAAAIVWSRGLDGKDDPASGGRRYPVDDRLSWQQGKVQAEK